MSRPFKSVDGCGKTYVLKRSRLRRYEGEVLSLRRIRSFEPKIGISRIFPISRFIFSFLRSIGKFSDLCHQTHFGLYGEQRIFPHDFERFHIVPLDCDCSCTRNRHFVPRRQDFGTGLREIIPLSAPQNPVSKGGVSTRHDFASGFSHRKQARSLY